MKSLALGLLFLLLSACSPTVAAPSSPTPTGQNISPTAPVGEYLLRWADEFDLPDGSPPDPAKWNYSVGGHGWGNGELQYYTDRLENARIENGMLVIKAMEEDYLGRHYTSARLNTMVKGAWKYGRIEIRARLPATQGIWPAFWMLPALARYGNWPASGEIDIMELVGKEPGRVYGTLHYGNPHTWVSGHYDLPDGQTFADDFHVFALEWEPTAFRWYVDEHQYFAAHEWFTSKEGASYPAPFDQEFYLIINVAVGGYWPGNPDATSVFPQSMYVDYVRVYQKPSP